LRKKTKKRILEIREIRDNSKERIMDGKENNKDIKEIEKKRSSVYFSFLNF